MGMVALNCSSNDFCFGNRDVMRIINLSKNRFEEIIQYLHFSDSSDSVEPAHGRI